MLARHKTGASIPNSTSQLLMCHNGPNTGHFLKYTTYIYSTVDRFTLALRHMEHLPRLLVEQASGYTSRLQSVLCGLPKGD